MDFYRITLEGMKKLLDDCNKKSYSDMIEYSLEKWNSRKDTNFFVTLFSEKGSFQELTFDVSEFSSQEKLFWTQQLFSALAAMAIQLADFIKHKKSCDINFIRTHFGHPAQMISGSACANCGARQINIDDVDRYISSSIIAKRVVDGLENGNLNENIEAIMTLSAPEIQREREHTKTRIMNSSVPFSQNRTRQTFCLNCGSKDIKKCKFLKSIKDVVFVPLSKLE